MDYAGPGLARPRERAGLDRNLSPLGWLGHDTLSVGPLNRPVHITPNGSTNIGLPPNGPNSALRSRTPAVPSAPSEDTVVTLMLSRSLAPASSPCGGSRSDSRSQSLSLLCTAPVLSLLRPLRAAAPDPALTLSLSRSCARLLCSGALGPVLRCCSVLCAAASGAPFFFFGSHSNAQMFLEPPYYPSLDAAKTFLAIHFYKRSCTGVLCR
jgi:hypothetical protein